LPAGSTAEVTSYGRIDVVPAGSPAAVTFKVGLMYCLQDLQLR